MTDLVLGLLWMACLVACCLATGMVGYLKVWRPWPTSRSHGRDLAAAATVPLLSVVALSLLYQVTGPSGWMVATGLLLGVALVAALIAASERRVRSGSPS